MARPRLLPRFVACVTLGGCGGATGTDGGVDAGCQLPSDFPPDASQSEVVTVCECRETQYFHCLVEGGPRCDSWLCFPTKTADGGYQPAPDGGVACLC
jgi:hypothetical protein